MNHYSLRCALVLLFCVGCVGGESRSQGLQSQSAANAGTASSPSDANNSGAVSNGPASTSTDPNAAPVITSFVSRTGSTLSVDGKPYRFAGSNIYWMAGSDPEEVREALATAQTMGATMVRANNLGTFLGHAGTLEPSLNNFDQAAFATLDYAIQMAGKYGIHLQLPLTDNYDYGGIGKYDFLRWRGLSDGNDFYTNADVISDFKAYIKNYLTHVNTLTGIAYKDDPTIAIWETGNELGAYMLEQGAPPVAWTQEIADYIKSIDANHLVMDGSDGINKPALNIASVDVYSDHFYPLSLSAFQKDESVVTAANKVLVIGEYDWTEKNGGDKLIDFLTAMEQGSAAGDMFWSLFVHDPSCSDYVQHGDGYTMHWPGDNDDMSTRANALRQHAFTMSGLPTPKAEPVECPQPEP